MNALEKLGYVKKATKSEGSIWYEKEISQNIKKVLFCSEDYWDIFRIVSGIENSIVTGSLLDYEEIAAMAEIQKEAGK